MPLSKKFDWILRRVRQFAAGQRARALWPFEATRFRLYRKGGLLLLLDRTNLIDLDIIRFDWEERQRAFLFAAARHLKSTTGRELRFLDIGAHWGYYSLEAWQSGLFHEVHAFEPDPYNKIQLTAQLMLNGALDGITMHEVVLSDRPGPVQWAASTEREPHNRGSARMAKQGSLTLNARPLDAIVRDDGSLLVVKIDVEGFENAVLRGSQRLMREAKAFLQIEIFENNVKRVDALLSELGYRKIAEIKHDRYFTNIDGFDPTPPNDGR